MRKLLFLIAALPALAAAGKPTLFEWERGFGLRVSGEPEADMFFWIYEWNMFEAMRPGEHTHGTYQLPRTLQPGGAEALVDSPALRLVLRAVEDGAELELRVTNTTEATWPALAGIIPCWNPGMVGGTNPSMPAALNRNFADPWRQRTFFVSADGLTALTSRAIHFNHGLRVEVDRASAASGGRFAFSQKWPTSEVEAVAGILVREAEDGRWVTGIAWEDFLSVQGHNPWNCMHACVRIGALEPGESRTLRGRLYLFMGTKEDCVARFRRDFPRKP
jgi:hypothetical protein